MMLAVVALGFTACEDEINRDPSPEFDGKKAVFFPISEEAVEIDPKDAFEHQVVIVRTNSEEEVSVKLIVDENTQDVFVVPGSVNFAKGQDTLTFTVKFPKAEIDSTYNLFITLDDGVSSPYREELPTYALTVNVAKWNDVNTQAVFFDGFTNVFYAVGHPGWYAKYQRKDNADGSFDIRLINLYTVLPEYGEKDGKPDYDAPIADKFGIYGGYPYNYPEDVDSKNTYNMVVHVAKDGSASFDSFELGMIWTYGMFFGAYYPDGGPGFYKAEDQTITFPAGSVLCGMADYKGGELYDGEEDLVIYLDSAIYQDIHSAITVESLEGGFNDESLQWNVMPGNLKTVVSSVESDSWQAELLNVIDPNPEDKQGEGSDFFNLYMIPDMYATGYGLAFYWDTIKGKVEIPIYPQETGMKVASQMVLVSPSAENESYVEEIELKGNTVKVFHLFVFLSTENGGSIGDYEEVFYYGPEAVVWEEKDYLGQFIITGPCQFAGYDPLEEEVAIDKKGNDLFMVGVPYCDTLWLGFDAKSGVLSIESQQCADVVIPEAGTFDMTFQTADLEGNPSASPILLAFGLDGIMKPTADSECDGYYVLSQAAGGAVDGYYGLRLAPAPVKKEIAPKTYVQKFAAKKVSRTARVSTKANTLKVIGRVPKHHFRRIK